jgi:hypothetical protein
VSPVETIFAWRAVCTDGFERPKGAPNMENARTDHTTAGMAFAPFIGAHADYRAEDYVFPRAQSPALREADWDERIHPLKPWSAIVALSLLGVASVATALAVL